MLWKRGGSCTFVILTSKRGSANIFLFSKALYIDICKWFFRMYAMYAKILDMSPGYTPCETISQLWILARGRFLFLKWSLNFHDGKRGRRWRTCFSRVSPPRQQSKISTQVTGMGSGPWKLRTCSKSQCIEEGQPLSEELIVGDRNTWWSILGLPVGPKKSTLVTVKYTTLVSLSGGY